jgi:hypothetical protein
MTSGAEAESFLWSTSRKSVVVESRNDEAAFSVRESGKNSTGSDKEAVCQYGKVT